MAVLPGHVHGADAGDLCSFHLALAGASARPTSDRLALDVMPAAWYPVDGRHRVARVLDASWHASCTMMFRSMMCGPTGKRRQDELDRPTSSGNRRGRISG